MWLKTRLFKERNVTIVRTSSLPYVCVYGDTTNSLSLKCSRHSKLLLSSAEHNRHKKQKEIKRKKETDESLLFPRLSLIILFCEIRNISKSKIFRLFFFFKQPFFLSNTSIYQISHPSNLNSILKE